MAQGCFGWREWIGLAPFDLDVILNKVKDLSTPSTRATRTAVLRFKRSFAPRLTQDDAKGKG